MKRLVQINQDPIFLSCSQTWEQHGWNGDPFRQSDYINNYYVNDWITNYYIIADDNLLEGN